jgi:microcystin degradation protein MlrC
MPLGTSVWFETGGVHLLINDTRSQVFHPEAFTDLGMYLSKMKIVIVKGSIGNSVYGAQPMRLKRIIC